MRFDRARQLATSCSPVGGGVDARVRWSSAAISGTARNCETRTALARTTHIRTLILDDDERVGQDLTRGLVAAGFDVVFHPTLPAAVEYLTQAYRHVVIADLQLEGVEIAELAGALRCAAPQAALIGTLAFPEVEPVLAAVRAGFADVVEKPIHMAALLHAIERQLTRSGLDITSEEELLRRIGQRVRMLRAERGLSQSEAAERAGISSAQLSQIESGRSSTTLWTLTRIGQELDVPLARLLEWSATP